MDVGFDSLFPNCEKLSIVKLAIYSYHRHATLIVLQYCSFHEDNNRRNCYKYDNINFYKIILCIVFHLIKEEMLNIQQNL